MSYSTIPKSENKIIKPTGNKETQTVYRESETQTQVWTPKYVVKSGDPEVLRLNHFLHGKLQIEKKFIKVLGNLPAGKQEVESIERMRKRRAWENYLGAIYSESNKDLRRKIISEIELNENMFRDKEFGIKNNEKMCQVDDYIKNFQNYMDERTAIRVRKVAEKTEQEKAKIYQKLHCKKTRSMGLSLPAVFLRVFRKIHKKLLGINMKYHKTDIFEEVCDETSDLYVNIVRFGKNPRYRHEDLEPEATEAILDITPSKTPKKIRKKRFNVKKHNCQQKLTVGEEEFIAIRSTREMSRKETMAKAPLPGTTVFQSRKETDFNITERPFLEKIYQAAVLFQRLIKGRAIQALMQIGLEKNRDLIDELKGSLGFTLSDEDGVNEHRYLKMSSFRDYHWLLSKYGMVATVSKKLAGATTNSIVDFANKELTRVQDERRAYKIAQMAERAKWRREAAEGGRRQKEIRRRRQHDEMYRQVMRSNEITTDFYLKLLTESAIKAVSKEQAHEKMVEYADKMEEEDIKQAKEDKTEIERMEIAAQIIHSFLLPESEKEIIRKRIEDHQEKSRDFARRVIYGELAGRKFYDKKETVLLEDLDGNLVDLEDDGEKKFDEEVHEEIKTSLVPSSISSELGSEEEEIEPLPLDVKASLKHKLTFDDVSEDSKEDLLQEMEEMAKKEAQSAPIKVEEHEDKVSIGGESIAEANLDCSNFPPVTIDLQEGDLFKDHIKGHPTKAYQIELDDVKGKFKRRNSSESSGSDLS